MLSNREPMQMTLIGWKFHKEGVMNDELRRRADARKRCENVVRVVQTIAYSTGVLLRL